VSLGWSNEASSSVVDRHFDSNFGYHPKRMMVYVGVTDQVLPENRHNKMLRD
jgi:hypothetical protein